MSDDRTSSCLPLYRRMYTPWFDDKDLDSDVWARIKATRVLTGQGGISFMLIPALVSVGITGGLRRR